MKCDNCGYNTVELSCKIMCPVCGQRQDCSDLFVEHICEHFECEIESACRYCENYKQCILNQGDLNFE